jgi:hypothetical protein
MAHGCYSKIDHSILTSGPCRELTVAMLAERIAFRTSKKKAFLFRHVAI